jgi:hypothetical protein
VAGGGYAFVPAEDGSDDELIEADIVPPGPRARAAAALAYLGAFCLIVFFARPVARFARLHSRAAVVLHVLRFVWVAGVILLWWQLDSAPGVDYDVNSFGVDAGLLLLVGIPSLTTLETTDLQAWIVWPLAITWVGSLAGFLLAAGGKTADVGAFVNADWDDIVPRNNYYARRVARERQRARAARQRHMERLQRTTRVVGVERVRQERSREIEEQIERLQAEREHTNQLLALGEISRRRFDASSADIDAEISALRSEMDAITSRASAPRVSALPSKLRVNRLGRSPESAVETVAIVTPSGIPLFSYGSFQLDDALVAGILSAFDSISEEVFGSRVHKTELAEGQVLHFAHGQYVIILAVFTEEPSPRQVQQLRQMLQHFEAANDGPLKRQDYDPERLHEVPIPFEFHERV